MTTLRIAVSSEADGGLDGTVAHHFGRCPVFTVVAVQDGRIAGHEVVANPFAGGHEPGQVPAFLAGLDVDAVLSGGMGMRALQHFQANGITPSTGHVGGVRDAVEAWLGGDTPAAAPCRESVQHHEEGRTGP